MKLRLIIFLSIFAAFGFYSQQAYAASCSAHRSCMPPMDAGHTDGAGGQGCDCSSGGAQLSGRTCGTIPLVQQTRQLFLRPLSYQLEPVDAGSHAFRLENITMTDPTGLPRGPDNDLPPLSCPIYLQTLALLC